MNEVPRIEPEPKISVPSPGLDLLVENKGLSGRGLRDDFPLPRFRQKGARGSALVWLLANY